MTDYFEWLEATVGTGALDGATDPDTLQQATSHQQRRDAVLCLVDCQLSMFHGESCTGGPGDANPAAANSARGGACARAVPLPAVAPGCLARGAATTDDSLRLDVDGNGGEASVRRGAHVAAGSAKDTDSELAGNRANTPFRDAVRCVLGLYQDKVMMSDKDLVALALYNTNVRRNIYDLPGLYIFHPFALLSVEAVQELEGLAAAGDVSSKAYAEFKKNVGHAQGKEEIQLSEVLWAAQHMFLSLHSNVIKYRRVFIFTNDDAPHKGDAPELERCLARVRELCEAEVTVEVFAIGENPGTGAAALDMGREDATFRASHRTTCVADAPPHDDMDRAEAIGRPTGGVCAGRKFNREIFWDQLHRGALQGAEGTTGHDHVGAVHMTGGVEVFDHLLHAVRRRTHPQRPFQNYTLTIGVGVDGSPVPTMAVSAYHPTLPVPPQRVEWLDRRTNAIVPRRTQLVVRRPPTASDPRRSSRAVAADAAGREHPRPTEQEQEQEKDEGEEEDTETIVTPDRLLYSTVVGGRRLFFSPQERQHIFHTATAGAAVGFSILCFKHAGDVLLHRHAIAKSTFLRPNPHDGGEASLRLFVHLTRTLLRQKKVAVAQYVARQGAAPRLVALAPSPPAVSVPERSLPAKGLGLYVVPLPYAEDLRAVPSLPCFGPATVPSHEDLDVAARVVASLSVAYDISAVPNPSLQLRHQTLQEMALRPVAVSGALQPGVVADMSLPDRVGMAQHAPLFHEFAAKLLGPSYGADRLCPQPKRGGIAAAKTPHAEKVNRRERDDGVGDAVVHLVEAAFEQNALPTLTVAQLRAYLSAVGESAAGARRKEDVIGMVTRALLRRREGGTAQLRSVVSSLRRGHACSFVGGSRQ
ncbi:putative KU70 protein [Trypanosoma conorhini]|uniref:Putative KU70 protein n=1 Tax=Trypanosoma conorhini TaxID=83891 RepID=A0A3R7MY87_9TRYP|nr:putative KU70 protein [Trypanosoma conorhini]RNF13127.1 putative KU70 protein [Trypanosoma conorhini]